MASFSAGFRQALMLTGTVLMSGLVLARTAHAESGKSLYESICGSCHKNGGAGVVGKFPPLKDRVAEIAGTADGRTWLTHVVMNGLTGTITAGGESYAGYMPSFRALPDDQLASILTYVASLSSSSQTVTFTADEVKAARGQTVTAPDLIAERNRLAAVHSMP
ncbi:cytochrome c [Acetobacter sp. AN02]|uniref:c-type cytochrome n=1 Tax=Acetobacter sp. AN02 TaxID=2894186 RepID=UPI0024342185|nr:cytochrome c [Acetobacter sp. AN02]MDG6094730.1 cytochrome c [Acetobacter sp. AN02]